MVAGSTRDILIRLLGQETISPAADQAGRGLDRLGDKMDDVADEARHLDREIEQAEGALRELARQFARTEDAATRVDLTKQIRKQQSELRKLTSARSLLGDGDGLAEGQRLGARLAAGITDGLMRSGAGISAALGSAVGTLPPQAQLALGAGVVAAAAAAAPAIGATISGAVVGAAGTGGVIGGLIVASKHSDVKAAAQQTGQTFAEVMQRSFADFVPSTVGELGKVNAQLRAWEGSLARIGSASSRHLGPLVDGVLGGIDRALPGIVSAVERAGPVVGAVGAGFVEMGDAVGTLFGVVADNASEGAHALGLMFGVVAEGVRVVAVATDALSTMYGIGIRLSGLLTGNVAAVAQLDAPLKEADAAGGDFSTRLQEIMAGFRGTAGAAAGARVEVESFDSALRRMRGEFLDADQAASNLEQAIDAAADAAKRNGDGIDDNIPKQRANRDALRAIAFAARESYDAVLASTKSHDLAAASTERARAGFIAAARAMGLSKEEAEQLAARMLGIPNVNRTVTVTTRERPHDLRTVAGRIAAIRDRRVVITIDQVTRQRVIRSEGRNVAIGEGIGGRASGGPVAAGETYWVGERGPELVTFGRDGYVHDATTSARLDQLRRSLTGAARSAPMPASGLTPAPAGPAAVAPPVFINAAGAAPLERMFVAWLVRAVQSAGGDPRVLGLGGTW